jgi:hypothetical protein
MNMNADDRRDRYLWDPGAPPDPDVQSLERRLAPARFDPARHPLLVPAAAPRGRLRFRAAVALAAAAVVVIGVGLTAFWSWRWSWTPGASWAAEIDNAADRTASKTALALNHPLQLSPTSSARVEIARIGSMQVSAGSALTLTETTSRRHRVMLDRGAVNVRIWAPPGVFAFGTPAGTVRDLGCIFALSVDAEGTAHVRVDTGWVQMDNDYGESLVPAGAAAVMRRLSRPGVPVFVDSSEIFAAAVRRAEEGGDAAEQRELPAIVRTARHRDVLTLLMLANVSPPDVKRTLLTRAAELWPPPAGVSVDAILAGDREGLWKWHGALDLPPVKNWWRNWRDALPLRD